MNCKNFLSVFTVVGALCAGSGYAATQSGEASMFKAPGGVDLRAAMSFNESWEETPFPYGIYSVSTVDGIEPEFVFLTDERNMEGGAVYVDGVIHAISKLGDWLWDDEDEGWYFQQKGAAFTTFDAETGEVLFDTTDGLSTDLFTSDLCYDATTGNIYGVFKVKGYLSAWGILDVDNLTVEYLNEKMSTSMSAIAADKNGVIYGLTGEGSLVTINKETGEISEPLAEYKKYQGYKSTGVIDPQTNTFYWLLHSYGDAGLYSIDLNNYEITKITPFRNYERWGGAYIAQVVVDEGTPAAASNLTINFPMGTLTGTVTFDAADISVDDEDLTGTVLDYVVNCDDEVVAQGKVNAGATITSDPFTLTEGYHDITIVLSNEMGDGMPSKLSYWFGNDAPANVNNLTAINDGYSVNISWSAPTQGVHNGYFDPEAVTYNVIRMPDNVLVAENLTETSYTDEISSKKVAKYYYQVIPYFANMEGRVAETQGLIIGDGVNLPYETNFSDEDCEFMTVEDTNGDGNTWDIGEEEACYRFGDVDGDDWLFTAPLYLETGTAYCLTAQLKNGWNDRLEKYEIKLGTAPDSKAMTQTIVEPTEFESQYSNVEEYISVPTTGTYFIGIHAMSPESHFVLSVNFIKFEVAMSDEAPAAGEITAVAGEKGALSATLTITAPTQRFNGKELDELEGVNIFHNGSLIDSMDDIEPGKTYTYTHESSTQGFNNYSIVFVNENGNGLANETTVFVGNDVPLAPKNVHFEFEDGYAVVTWDTPGERGVNGGYVDPETLVYSPCYVDNGDWVLMDETKEHKASVKYDTTGKQRWFLFGLMAYNEMGESEAAYSNNMIVGNIYEMPYLESLDNGVNKTMFASTNIFGPVGGYGSDTELSASEIGGCLKFNPYSFIYDAPYIDTLTTGVINTAGHDNVTLSFYYYNDAAENNGDELTAALYDQDNDITYNLGSVKMDGSATEWRKFEASKAINSDNLRIHIGIISNNGNTIYLDEFKLDDPNGSSVAQICGDGVKVVAAENEIIISGLEGENVTVVSISGITLYNGTTQGEISVPATSGMYVVKVADRSVKVIVK